MFVVIESFSLNSLINNPERAVTILLFGIKEYKAVIM